MPTYIALGRLTAQAKRNPEAALRSRDRILAEFQKKGFKITSYMTLGSYDAVLIIDAPSEELLVQFLMAAGATGDIDTTTLRAFAPSETDRFRAGPRTG